MRATGVPQPPRGRPAGPADARRHARRGSRARGPGRRPARSRRARARRLVARRQERAPAVPPASASPVRFAAGFRPRAGRCWATGPATLASVARRTASASSPARASNSRPMRSRSARVALVRSSSVRPTSLRTAIASGTRASDIASPGPAGGQPRESCRERRVHEPGVDRGSARRPDGPPDRA